MNINDCYTIKVLNVSAEHLGDISIEKEDIQPNYTEEAREIFNNFEEDYK